MGFLDRLFGKKPRNKPTSSTDGAHEAFAVGDRVKDTFGSLGVVKSIDPNAELGLGCVVVKMDDGRKVKLTLVGCGLERVAH